MYSVRKSPRMPGFDYSTENYYFVTVCTNEKKCLFGKPGQLNTFGNIVKRQIEEICEHFPRVQVDNFVVMPNHIHMILILGCDLNSGTLPSLETVVGSLKSGVSKQIHKLKPDITVWQRSFHDHVIKNQKAYENIWQYVTYNHQKWTEDCFYIPDAV